MMAQSLAPLEVSGVPGTMWCTSLKLGRGSCEWPRCRFSHDIRDLAEVVPSSHMTCCRLDIAIVPTLGKNWSGLTTGTRRREHPTNSKGSLCKRAALQS